ncbi:MAG: O-antigen ligase family protein, partial [Chloroflexi bacterium]|nr:O-antigen ligase family protein [Chloroflexota bacterium]
MQLETCDYAVLFFVIVSALSVPLAANFGVANRELRVNIIEPALLYALIRASSLQRRDLYRLIHALILSAVAISLIGLYQLLFTDYVIIGEGVRRVLSVYGSPNNLALYLDRMLPLVVTLAIFGLDLSVIASPEGAKQSPTRNLEIASSQSALPSLRSGQALAMTRFLYTIAAFVIAICLYFTYSRGALLLGLPAGFLALGFFGGRRARATVIALIIVSAIVFIPFAQTERGQSFFQTGTGTGFFRVSVWQSALAMIRDHPIFGVGLDNFLYEYPKYMNPDAWREPNLSHPHNIVLDFWARLGIAGVIALIWMVVEFYRRGLIALQKNRALALGLIAAMTAALAHGLIDAAFFYVDLAF